MPLRYGDAGRTYKFRLLRVLGSAVAFCLLFGGAVPKTCGQVACHSKRSFRGVGSKFYLDGSPFQVIAGHIDYARVPPELWRNRLQMARAEGLNTVETSVFWNLHEPEPGRFEFSGNKDVKEFVRQAQQEGLLVILRVGPYVADDWDFGGYPSWLLGHSDVMVGSEDADYLAAVDAWIKRLAGELRQEQITCGGPVILMEVEAGFRSPHSQTRRATDAMGDAGLARSSEPGASSVLAHMRGALLEAGFDGAQLFTTSQEDPVDERENAGLPEAIDIDGDSRGSSAVALAQAQPLLARSSVLFVLRAGKPNVWGMSPYRTDVETEVVNLSLLLKHGSSVVIYPFHGGTNFELTSGARAAGGNRNTRFQPFTTSNDEGAALDEGGRPTAKFYRFREVIAKATGLRFPPVPESPAPIVIAPFGFPDAEPLWSALPAPVESRSPPTMEQVGQQHGYILYRTRLPIGTYDTGLLTIHDLAYTSLSPDQTQGPSELYVLSKQLDFHKLPASSASRLTGADQIRRAGGRTSASQSGGAVNSGPEDQWYSVIVEDLGHVSAGTPADIQNDRKGIAGYLAPEGQASRKWFTYRLPMDDVGALRFRKSLCVGPCFYRGKFRIDTVGDSFLDVSELGHGRMWINGHSIGRFWELGPSHELYVPAVWLKSGDNQVIVFDVIGRPFAKVSGRLSRN